MTLEEKLCIYYYMGGHEENYKYCELINKFIEKDPNIIYVQKSDTKSSNLET